MLRARALAYAQRRAAEGVRVLDIAGELGLHERTVERWLATAVTTARALVPVRIVDDARSPSNFDGAVVLTPSGLRIEGLDVETLCTLVARCG
ncbi:MAG: helix-turn-helix domain-containing protein [Labilithrix sp.]|nr:helix-turn-helix domain-containing protein [Labilithrix sp.]